MPAAIAVLADPTTEWSITLLVLYSAAILGASLLGGWLPMLVRLTHGRMQLMVSFVGGLMLGIAVFHLQPHSVAETGSLETSALSLMVGLLVTFFLIRAFHFHSHEPPQEGHERAHDHDHDHDCAEHAVTRGGDRAHRLSWIGVATGLSLHTLMDGLALGASVKADSGHDVFLSLFGFGTFLAIALHKPLDAISITALMQAGGWSPTARHLVNVGYALMCPLGATLFYLGADRLAEHEHLVIGCGLAFAAGVFLCISLGDLLPEVELHSHDRLKLSAALLLGIVLAYAIGYLEPGTAHAFPPVPASTSG